MTPKERANRINDLKAKLEASKRYAGLETRRMAIEAEIARLEAAD